MSMLDGVSQCWMLSKDCVIWWEAWTMAAAAFAGIGSWLAALATYFAVVKPMQYRKNEVSAVAAAEMENFAGDLISLRMSMGVVGFNLGRLKPGRAQAHGINVSALARTVAVPSLQATPETLPLVQALNRLRRAIANWNQGATSFDLEIDPDMSDEFEPYVIDDLNSKFDELMDAIRATALLIKPLVPSYAQELEWILAPHNGFLVLPAEDHL